jgi:hypothetical protein
LISEHIRKQISGHIITKAAICSGNFFIEIKMVALIKGLQNGKNNTKNLQIIFHLILKIFRNHYCSPFCTAEITSDIYPRSKWMSSTIWLSKTFPKCTVLTGCHVICFNSVVGEKALTWLFQLFIQEIFTMRLAFTYIKQSKQNSFIFEDMYSSYRRQSDISELLQLSNSVEFFPKILK